MITAPSSTALDYSGTRAPLAAQPALLWQVSIGHVVGHTRLLSWRGRALIAQPGEGLRELGANPDPESWRHWQADLSSVGPGWQSDPVVIAKDAGVYRCGESGQLLEVHRAQADASTLAAIAVSADHIVLKHYPDGAPFFELHERRMLWRKDGAALHLLPHGSMLFWGSAGGVQCLDRDSGDVVWTCATSFQRFIGVVDPDVWIVASPSTLSAIDSRTRALVGPIAVENNRALLGVLDAGGAFHTTTGLRYQVYDLSRGAVRTADHVLQGSSTAAGDLAAVSADGRVAFTDDRGRLFMFDPERPTALTPLWASTSVLGNPVIADGRLYLLDGGTLLCFG